MLSKVLFKHNIADTLGNIRSSIDTNNITFAHAMAKNPKQLDARANKFFRHTSEKHQILIFLSGSCTMTTDDYTHVLQPGDVCFNPAMSYYGITILEDIPYERILITLEPNKHFDKLAYEVFDDLKPINVNLNRLLFPFIERYKEYAQALPMKQFPPLAMNMLEELIYICLMEKNAVYNIVDTTENILKAAISYIDANWASIKNVQELAAALFISPSYLYDIFNKKLNMAPKAYLMRKRLQAAHAYLISGISPNEVSQLVGFNTYTAFYRACKAFYGKTPQEIWVKVER